MARGKGKKSLAELTDPSEIIDIGEERGAPNLLIDEDYGICADAYNYILVNKKIAYRTGTEDDGENNGKVIKYIKWDDVNYHPTIFHCFQAYFNEKALSETKKLNKCKEYKEVARIYLEIKNSIDKCISNLKLSNGVKESADVVDMIEQLKLELKEVTDVLSEADELRELIKEKKRLIIKDTEPKKHRIKEETD